MCLPPLLYGGDEREVTAFFATIASATELPLMVYNNPVASGGTDLLPGFLLQLAEEVDTVVAVKECSGDARRIAALVGGPLECWWAATTGRSRASPRARPAGSRASRTWRRRSASRCSGT